MTDSAYLRSLRAIKPREIDLFQRRRETERFRAVPPEQDVFERAIVAAWQVHQEGVIISIDAICAKAPELSEMQVAELAESPYFQQALTARGIPYGDTLNRLTAEQLFAIQAMTDTSITTPVMQRLRRLGISMKQWTGWLRQPIFADTYRRLREAISQDMVDPILTSLSMMATSDVGAAKLALEIAGVYTPGASTMAEERRHDRIQQAFVEAIEKYVKDDETLKAIGEHVSRAAAGEPQPVEVVALPATGTDGR